MNTWKLEEDQLDLNSLRKMESLFAQGNGYLGWRGSFEEGAGEYSQEGCYINGFCESYPIRYPEIAYAYPEQGHAMLNLMNAKGLFILVDGETVAMNPGQVSGYHREMDFRTGVLERRFVYTAKGGKALEVVFRRLVSQQRQPIGAISLTVTPLNFSGAVQIMSTLDTRASNQTADKDPRVGSHLPPNCFEALSSGAEQHVLFASQRTLKSRLPIACAAAHVWDGTEPVYAEENGCLKLTFTFAARQDAAVTFEKHIAYVGGIAPEDGDQLPLVLEAAQAARTAGFAALLGENTAYLNDYWKRTDIEIQGDEMLQQGLRFNSFHILQSVGKDGLRNVAAKGLTGEGYEGHYFWDTEIYVIPSLLYTNPAVCRKLLEYRHHYLPQARERAREMGHPIGALFPWRSIRGTECSTFFPAGTAQYHINGDIALAVKNYIQSSGDTDFLERFGAEILFETARLFADLGHYSKKDGLFRIDCVTGPDEYTACVNNNFYTNRIARENLWYAYKVYEQLKAENPAALKTLSEAIGLKPAEPETWKKAGDAMYFPYDSENGVFLQDDCFADKADWDFEGTREQHPLLLHFHPLVIYRHRVLKQADTVLADFMLDEYVDEAQIRRDYDYYEPLTTHDSSLSACIHSIVASRVGYSHKAYDYFLRSVRTDLDDHKGNTRDGVHIANMAGTSMCIVNGFAGVRQVNGQLHLRPTLPEKWAGYTFKLLFNGRLIQVKVNRQGAALCLLEGESLPVTLNGDVVMLNVEKEYRQ